MEIGELLSFTQNEIYDYAVTKFQEHGIPPTLAILVMKGICTRFYDSAINQTLNNLSKKTAQYEMLKNTLKQDNSEENADGDTTEER